MNRRRPAPLAMRRRRDRRGGYLLVEAIATLAIGAMILAGLASLSGLLLRAGDRAASRAGVVEVVGRTVAALRRDIAPAARLRWASPSGAEANAGLGDFIFTGTSSRLILARDVTGPDGLAAAVVTIFEVDRRDPRRRLLVAEAPLPREATGPRGLTLGPVREAYAGPLDLRFGYEGRGPDGVPVLRESWTDPASMPAVVVIDILDAAGAPAYPPVRIPLRITAEAACIDITKPGCSLAPAGSGANPAAGEPAQAEPAERPPGAPREGG
ncbi:hypothetical protein [Methylobrevis albus]|uniref:General secretion pathway protein J n=1 Tax=Methylobrevis albus TaxID=2793297 RepID=A0A931I240_9HYPH|nr:hypothetical protein [Methylobrevis albus]MBH0237856.1 hypothetical protein [Methylobrevis albus]